MANIYRAAMKIDSATITAICSSASCIYVQKLFFNDYIYKPILSVWSFVNANETVLDRTQNVLSQLVPRRSRF